MSSLDITKEQDSRMAESRVMLMRAMDIAMGSYIEQESSKFDNWRDKTFWQNTQHLSHEVKEISRSKTTVAKLHNAIDALSLSAILVAQILLERDETGLDTS